MADPNWLDELEAYMGKPPARGALDFETVRRLLRVARAAEADRAELARLRRVAARAAHLLRSRGSAAEEFAASALREELRGEP